MILDDITNLIQEMDMPDGYYHKGRSMRIDDTATQTIKRSKTLARKVVPKKTLGHMMGKLGKSAGVVGAIGYGAKRLAMANVGL